MKLGDFKGVKNKYKFWNVNDLKRHSFDKIDDFIDVSCVYLLYDGYGRIIYVGQTDDLENRFYLGHKMAGKFHAFSIIKFKEAYEDYEIYKRRKQREKLEKFLIRKFKPRFNKEHNPDWEGSE